MMPPLAMMTDSLADGWDPATPGLLVIGVIVSVAAYWLHTRAAVGPPPPPAEPKAQPVGPDNPRYLCPYCDRWFIAKRVKTWTRCSHCRANLHRSRLGQPNL